MDFEWQTIRNTGLQSSLLIKQYYRILQPSSFCLSSIIWTCNRFIYLQQIKIFQFKIHKLCWEWHVVELPQDTSHLQRPRKEKKYHIYLPVEAHMQLAHSFNKNTRSAIRTHKGRTGEWRTRGLITTRPNEGEWEVKWEVCMYIPFDVELQNKNKGYYVPIRHFSITFCSFSKELCNYLCEYRANSWFNSTYFRLQYY